MNYEDWRRLKSPDDWEKAQRTIKRLRAALAKERAKGASRNRRKRVRG